MGSNDGKKICLSLPYQVDRTISIREREEFYKSEEVTNKVFSVGLTSTQGKRSRHEDSELIVVQGNKGYFMVCDGHDIEGEGEGFYAARRVAEFFNENADLILSKSGAETSSVIRHLVATINEKLCGEFVEAYKRREEFVKLFPTIDDSFQPLKDVPLEELQKNVVRYYHDAPAIREDFLKCDNEALKKALAQDYEIVERTLFKLNSGCTFVSAFVEQQSDETARVHIVNIGDSRAVVYDLWGLVRCATLDHKIETDKARLEAVEARLDRFPFESCKRVVAPIGYCGLSVTRAIGDPTYKKSVFDAVEKEHALGEGSKWRYAINYPIKADIVSIDSDLYEATLTRSAFMVIACDGLWDVMKSEEVGKFVKERLYKNETVKEISAALVREALDKKSGDNISVIIITLQ